MIMMVNNRLHKLLIRSYALKAKLSMDPALVLWIIGHWIQIALGMTMTHIISALKQFIA